MKPFRISRILCLLLTVMLALSTALAEPAPYGEAINAFLKSLVDAKLLPEIDSLPTLTATPELEASELSIDLTDFLFLYLSRDEDGMLRCDLTVLLADMPDSVDTDEVYRVYLKSFDPALTDDEAIAALAQLHEALQPSADGYAMEAAISLPNFDCTKTLGQTEAVETLSILIAQP